MSGEPSQGSSKQLERILTDASIPSGNRIRRAALIETKMLVKLAAPAVVAYMINYLMSMSTQIFSGHLGNLEYAAASLGNTGIQIFAYGLLVYGHTIQFLLYAYN
jgi:multidrug resistance protein, MATE family